MQQQAPKLRIRATQLLAVLLLLFLLTGCAFKVKLVGQYDDIVDKSVHQIERIFENSIGKVVAEIIK